MTVIGHHVKSIKVSRGALSQAGQTAQASPHLASRLSYGGATILGGETVIGSNVTIGGNVFITHSVNHSTKVMMKEPDLEFD